MVIINMLYKKIVHVMLLCKEKLLTRHLERSETKSKDLNYCLFTNNSISERNLKRFQKFFRNYKTKIPKNILTLYTIRYII